MGRDDKTHYTGRMTNPDIHAIIFDNDGTLVDSEPISIRVLTELVAGHGFEIAHSVAMEKWAGRDLHEVLLEVESHLGRKLPDDFLDTFRAEQMSRLATEVTAIDGAAELLEAIDRPRCVASNAPQNKMRLCLETTSLLRFFKTDHLFSAYDVEAWKPKPDLFLHAADQMNTDPQHCAVVEDSRFGIEAGIAAGMQVFVLDPHGRFQPSQQYSRLACLSELIPIFRA